MYTGIKLSEMVDHPTFYIFFWILYIVSILVILNVLINLKTTYFVESKEGKPGPSGNIGEQGDEGEEAKCETGCKNKVCNIKIMRKLEKNYNILLAKSYGKELDPPKKINNRYIRSTIKRICHSTQFKEVSQLQHPFKLLEYIAEIFGAWIELLADADQSENKKHLQDYLNTYGEQREWESMISPDNNPFKEIEKYDIYYWGLNKEFHPRKIQAPVKPSPNWKRRRDIENTEPPIKAYTTNIYKQTYNSSRLFPKIDLSTWITPPLKINNKTYYPLGSTAIPSQFMPGYTRYVSQMGSNNENHIKVNNPLYTLGPSYSNVVVNGDKDLIRKPHPNSWSWKWNDYKKPPNARQFFHKKYKSNVTFWKANDFYEDGQLYRCFGGMTMNNYSMQNPSLQLGRENVPFVCINNKALDRVPLRPRFIWNDYGSNVKYRGSIWANNDGQYNLAHFNKGNTLSDINSYKIKDSFIDKNMEKPFTSNEEKDQDFGYGHHNKTDSKGDRSTSIFELLDLVMESDIESQNHKQKLFLSHSGLNESNSYLIREYDKDTFALNKCLKSTDTGKVISCNTTKPDQIWVIEFLGASKEYCLLKSNKTGEYLKSTKPWSYEVSGKISSINPSDPQFKPFLWKLIPKEGQK